MGTLTTGHQVSTGVEVDRSSYRNLPRTKTAILCLAVGRTTRYPVSGLGWTAMSQRSQCPTQSLGLASSPIIDTHT